MGPCTRSVEAQVGATYTLSFRRLIARQIAPKVVPRHARSENLTCRFCRLWSALWIVKRLEVNWLICRCPARHIEPGNYLAADSGRWSNLSSVKGRQSALSTLQCPWLRHLSGEPPYCPRPPSVCSPASRRLRSHDQYSIMTPMLFAVRREVMALWSIPPEC